MFFRLFYDGISYDFFINLPENWLLYLIYMFNLILRSETIPESWCKLLIFPLHKKGDDSLPSNYRLISLVNCIAKIFMQILLRRIEIFCSVNNLIPEFQSGFRRGRSCMDNIFTLNALIQLNTYKPRSRMYAIFVDFKAVFDSINHSLLWSKLQTLGFSSKFLNVLRSFYSRASAAVSINNEQTPFTPISKGVLQGEVMSPQLFSLFLSDLDTYLHAQNCRGIRINSRDEIRLLAYADDLVILADSPYQVNRMLSALESYCEEFKLTVNTDKTKIVLFKKDRTRQPISSFKFNSSHIDLVDSYNYLGITFSKNCKFDLAFKNVISNTKLAIGSTLRVINTLKITAWKDIEMIHDSLVSSVTLYGSEAWGPTHVNEIDKLQNIFFKRLLALPNNCPSHALRLETGRISLKSAIFKLIINWIVKLNSMNDSRYPKLCCIELCLLRERFSTLEQNWMNQIRPFFVDSDSLAIWESLPNTQHLNCDKMISNYNTFLRNNDISACRASHSLVLYKYVALKPCHSPADYLKHRDLSISYKRIYARMRLLSLYNEKLVIFKNSIVTKQEFCNYCHMPIVDKDVMFHCLSECPKTSELMGKFVNIYPRSVNSHLYILDLHQRDIIIQICGFLESWNSLNT